MSAEAFLLGRVKMATAKENVRALLDVLPEDTTYEDIQYHIYVRQEVERGMRDVTEGRVLNQKEIERRMAKWLTP
jgi:predicted transcriptional regulator